MEEERSILEQEDCIYQSGFRFVCARARLDEMLWQSRPRSSLSRSLLVWRPSIGDCH